MSNDHLVWLIRHQGEAGESDGGHIKAETLVDLSRDVGLARQDTSVAFVRQPCRVPTSFFILHLSLYVPHRVILVTCMRRVVQPVRVIYTELGPSQVVCTVDWLAFWETSVSVIQVRVVFNPSHLTGFSRGRGRAGRRSGRRTREAKRPTDRPIARRAMSKTKEAKNEMKAEAPGRAKTVDM